MIDFDAVLRGSTAQKQQRDHDAVFGAPAPQTPAEIATAAIVAAEAASSAADLREQVAARVGLPAGMGKRLRGEDAAALVDDAHALLAELSGGDDA